MKPLEVLNYQRAPEPKRASAKVAIFFSLQWISLTLGSASVVGFLIFAGWPATWSAGISIASFSIALFAPTAVGADRSTRAAALWLSGCGSVVFGAVGLVEIIFIMPRC